MKCVKERQKNLKLQRSKLLYTISIIVLFCFSFYYIYFKSSFEDFLISKTNSYVVIDKNFLNILFTKNEEEKEFFNKINRGLLLGFEENLNPKFINYNKSLFLFNGGFYSARMSIKMLELFEKEEDYWVLKDKYIGKSEIFDFLGTNTKLYLKKYGNNYVIGKNLYLLKFFDKEYEKKSLNKKLISAYKSGYSTAIDLSKQERFGLKTDLARGNIVLKNGRIVINYEVLFLDYSSMNNFKVNTNKNISNYYNDEGLYIDVKDLSPIKFLLFLYCIDYEKQEERIKNVNWKTLIDESTTESLFIPRKNSIMMEHRNSEFVKFLFNVISDKDRGAYVFGNQKLFVDENFIQVNNKFEKIGRKDISPEVFLKGRLKTKELMGFFGIDTGKFSEDYIDIEGKVKNNYINIQIQLDAEGYRKYLKEE